MNNTTVTLNDDLHYLDDIIQYYKHQNVHKVKIYSNFDEPNEYKHTLSIIYPTCKIEGIQFNSGILKRTCYINILQSKITTVRDSDTNACYITIDIKADISFGSTFASGVKFLCGSYSIEEMYNHYRKYDKLEYILLYFCSSRYIHCLPLCETGYYNDLNINDDAIVNLKADEFDRAFIVTSPLYDRHAIKKDTTFKYLVVEQSIKTTIDEYGDKHDVLAAYLIQDKAEESVKVKGE